MDAHISKVDIPPPFSCARFCVHLPLFCFSVVFPLLLPYTAPFFFFWGTPGKSEAIQLLPKTGATVARVAARSELSPRAEEWLLQHEHSATPK